MPWAMETKAGFGWGIVVVLVFLFVVIAMSGVIGSAVRSPALLIIPILVYIGFMAWVNRVK